MRVTPFPLPDNLVTSARRYGYEPWLATIPDTVSQLAHRWDIDVGDPFRPGGHTAWVAPARSAGGADLVLKVAWRHPEGEGEAAGLRRWDGDGTVRLHAEHRSESTVALLLERCIPGWSLAAVPETEQDAVVAGLLRRLWRPVQPGDGIAALEVMCRAGADSFDATVRHGDIDPGLARLGMDLLRRLPATAGRTVLLCTDLHAGNVLAARRQPWLVIDPKPFAGDPTYDVLQHMLNCRRLFADPRSLALRMAGLAGLDPERVLQWLFARCVQESDRQPALVDVATAIRPR